MIGAVLAGGENRRIPVLKGFLEVEGRPIMERSIGLLLRVFGRVVISTNMPECYFSLGVPLIGDIRGERGPMTGILSVLVSTGADAVFVVACDMPFIKEELVRYMADSFGQGAKGKEQGIDAVAPVFGGRTEPLFGIYTKGCIEPFAAMIEKGRRGLSEMLTCLRVRYIIEEEVRGLDPEGESFVNINTIEDYERIGGKTCSV